MITSFLYISNQKRKEAKGRRSIRTDILILLKLDGYLLLKYSWAIFDTPTLKYLCHCALSLDGFFKIVASLPTNNYQSQFLKAVLQLFGMNIAMGNEFDIWIFCLPNS